MPDTNIVDRHGRPFRKAALTQELAAPSMTGVRQAWMIDSVASSLTPMKLASLLSAANNGDDYEYLTLAEEMEERELHYASVLSTRKLAVEALPVVVEAADDTPQAKVLAEAVEQLCRKPAFEVLVSDLLDGLGKGRSTCELIWQFGQRWEPKEYVWRDPRYFRYHPDDPRELRLIDEADVYRGLPLPAYKFITHVPKLKTGVPVRSGLARLVSVAYMCKSFSLRDWMSFSELFGLPIRVGKFGQGAKDDDIKLLRSAVANIGSDAAAIIPESMRLEFIERSGGSGSGHQLFKELAEWLDKQISKAVLGQTASAEGTAGKLGNDDLASDVRSDLLKADAKQLARTLNRDLVRPYIDLNFGPQDNYPLIRFPVADPEDMAALVDAVDKLVNKGMKVSASEMRGKLGLSEPGADDELLQASAGLVPGVTGGVATTLNHACPTCSPVALNRAGSGGLVDDLAGEALNNWEPVMTGMIDPVRQLLDEVADEDEFLARLPELLETMDASELVEQLALASFKARATGAADA